MLKRPEKSGEILWNPSFCEPQTELAPPGHQPFLPVATLQARCQRATDSSASSKASMEIIGNSKRIMFRPCPEGMANSGPNMAIVETFFPTPIFLQY